MKPVCACLRIGQIPGIVHCEGHALSRLGQLLFVAVAVLALGAAGIAVSVFQRQSTLEVNHFLHSWALFKSSNEVNQFVATLSIFARGEGEASSDEVRMRLDILRSRVDIMRSGSTGAYINANPDLRAARDELDRKVTEAETAMAALDRPETARHLIAQFGPVASQITVLSSNAYNTDTLNNAERWHELNELKSQFWTVASLLLACSALLGWKTLRQQRHIGQANEQLRVLAAHSAASAAEFQDAIASLADGLILWDAQDRVSTWNARCEEILPYAKSVLRAGMSFAEYVQQATAVNHPQWSNAARAQRVAERISQHARRGGKGEFVTLDGRIIEVRENPTSNGGCISVFRDITAERRLLGRLTRNEAELQRALAAEREINAQQRQFVSMASHEFKTPLAIIDSTSQRLLVPGADAPKRVERIRSAVARMIEIIDRTLSTAQLEEGRVEFTPQRCDLRTLLAEVCERQRGIAQRFTLALDMPPGDLALEADPRLLDQVFSNLVSNAVKYSGPSTHVDIAVRATPETVSVSVRDHGLGIPDAEIDRLFTRFYRASTTLTIPGTGIGLHLVKQFVSLHGGEVTVTSEVSKGSTFTVRLPRRQQAAQPTRAVA